jgi:hypothetical protein
VAAPFLGFDAQRISSFYDKQTPPVAAQVFSKTFTSGMILNASSLVYLVTNCLIQSYSYQVFLETVDLSNCRFIGSMLNATFSTTTSLFGHN